MDEYKQKQMQRRYNGIPIWCVVEVNGISKSGYILQKRRLKNTKIARNSLARMHAGTPPEHMQEYMQKFIHR